MSEGYISEKMRAEAVESRTVNPRRVYDSAGRYYGELTGANDATVVQEAIDARPDRSDIIVPEPGIPLDWNETVEIPAHEAGFKLLTEGMVRLDIPADFDGDVALKKGWEDDSRSEIREYQIGSFHVRDHDGVLSWAMDIDSIKGAIFWPSKFENTPGIRIASEGEFVYSNQNLILRPFGRDRGPAVCLENSPGGTRSDQNWVWCPYFNEGTARGDEEYTETAFVDEGEANSWIYSRVEHAKVVHRMDGTSQTDTDGNLQNGCQEYHIHVQDWDRMGQIEDVVTVKDINGAHGLISGLRSHNMFSTLQTNAPTQIESGLTRHDRGTLVDSWEQLAASSPVNDLSDVGFQHGGDGSATLHPNLWRTLRVDTDSTEDSESWIDMGEEMFRHSHAAARLKGHFDASSSEVIARIGFVADESNRAELVYDPEGVWGDHEHSGWYFEAETDDDSLVVEEASVDDSEPFVTLRSHTWRLPDAGWSAGIGTSRNDESTFADIQGYKFSPYTVRLWIQTRSDDSKRLQLHRHSPKALYHLA